LLTIRPDDERYKKNALRLSRVLGIKSMAEYEERLVFRSGDHTWLERKQAGVLTN
jgi:hypothetical protein